MGKSQMVRQILRDFAQLENQIRSGGFTHVLLATYTEYLAPLWADCLLRLQRQGVTFSAILHDPDRSHVVGPHWWHNWSVKKGFSFLDRVFVHEDLDLSQHGVPMDVQKTVIPHGEFPAPKPTATRQALRDGLGLSAAAPVFLSFGHIRDDKNLDLILRALAQVPEAILIVAGGAPSASQTLQESDYRKLAKDLDISNRCHWFIRFIKVDELANFFTLCDFVLLTYSESFRSASGVLASTSSFERPVIASAGQSSLLTLVSRYQLGSVIKPDNVGEISRAMTDFVASPPCPDWKRFRAENSWERNARLVVDALETDASSSS